MRKTRPVLLGLVLLAVVGIGGLVLIAQLRQKVPQNTHSPSPSNQPRDTLGSLTDTTGEYVEKVSPITAEPEYVPPAVVDHRVTSFVNRESTEPRVTADITTRIPRVTHPKDIRAVVQVLKDTQDDDTVRNEAANLLRRSGYERLVDDLIGVLNNPDEKQRFRAFVTQHLYTSYERAYEDEKEKILATLHEALADRHVKVRREALLALVRVGDPKGKQMAVKWLLDVEADNVRDLAIHCVYDLDLREHISTIRKYLRHRSNVIRIAAIVVLSQWGDRESMPAFKEAAESKNVRLQRAGKAALKRMEKIPPAEPPDKF